MEDIEPLHMVLLLLFLLHLPQWQRQQQRLQPRSSRVWECGRERLGQGIMTEWGNAERFHMI